MISPVKRRSSSPVKAPSPHVGVTENKQQHRTRWARQCGIAIARNPHLAVAAAAAVGIAFGWLQRQR